MHDKFVTVISMLTVGILAVGGVVLAIGVSLLPLWIVLSVATSAVKKFSGECGKIYGIERVVNGDFFCAK